MQEQKIRLTPEIISEIENILNSGCRVNVSTGKEEIFVYSVKSKLNIRKPITRR